MESAAVARAIRDLFIRDKGRSNTRVDTCVAVPSPRFLVNEKRSERDIAPRRVRRYFVRERLVKRREGGRCSTRRSYGGDLSARVYELRRPRAPARPH